jgi:hypothetical protein
MRHVLMWAPQLGTKAWSWCAVSAGRRSRRESRKGGTLFVEFAVVAALKANGEECDEAEADEEDTEHEDPAPMGVDPRSC